MVDLVPVQNYMGADVVMPLHLGDMMEVVCNPFWMHFFKFQTRGFGTPFLGNFKHEVFLTRTFPDFLKKSFQISTLYAQEIHDGTHHDSREDSALLVMAVDCHGRPNGFERWVMPWMSQLIVISSHGSLGAWGYVIEETIMKLDETIMIVDKSWGHI